MSSVLVPIADLKEFLGSDTPSSDEALLILLVDQLEALFLEHAGRRDRPFIAADTAVDEVHDGTGGKTMWLRYPAAAITSIELGPDVTAPRETLDPADVHVVSWAVGSRALIRRDGGIFGTWHEPRVIHVTYDHQADLPASVALAIIHGAASIYRRRGAEDVSIERTGGYSSDFVRALADDALWQHAMAAHRELSL